MAFRVALMHVLSGVAKFSVAKLLCDERIFLSKFFVIG